VDNALQAPVIVTIAGLLLWLVVVGLQLSVIIAAAMDVRGARDSPRSGRQARSHTTELIFAVPVVALVGILLVFGVDIAGRLAFDWGRPIEAVLVLFGLVATSLIGGSLVVLAFTRGEVIDYASLRADLVDREGERFSATQLAQFSALLAEADERQRHIHLGHGNGRSLLAIRAYLSQLSDQFREQRPRGLSAVRVINWRTANTALWRASPSQLSAIAVSCVPVFAFIASLGNGSTWTIWAVVPVLAVLPVASYIIAVAGIRVTIASKVAWHAIAQNQRVDVVHLLSEFERSSRKGVAGLGDRVARALQILRDQQT
jgi:hypothetical protein